MSTTSNLRFVKCLYSPLMDANTHQSEAGIIAVLFAIVSNTLAWVQAPEHLAVINHAIGIIAGIIACAVGVYRIKQLRKGKK